MKQNVKRLFRVLLGLTLMLGLLTSSALADYTVEFTRGELQYVMPGDSEVLLSEILETVGLTGPVEAVEFSDESLFSASDETGEWIVTAHQAFSTTEWMKVTINGVVYEITVTDDAAISYLYFANEAAAIAGTTSSGSCTAYTVVRNQTAWGVAGQETWYVVNSTVTISDRVTVSGNVHLILVDGYTLTAPKGIRVSGGNRLTIYGQSAVDSTMGVLKCRDVSSSNAAIGGNDSESSGQITINGGKINVRGGSYAAGIGGGYHGSGTVTINGGIVTANTYESSSSGCAGIGGGYSGDGTVTINGGTVTATGSAGGAGIGGGGYGAATVTIHGGSVKATGGEAGAGIGSGSGSQINHSYTATVTISGGTVDASTGGGSGYKAAIGCGAYTTGIVTITGGNVTATATYNSVCIGGMPNDTGTNIVVTITGGNVTARPSTSTLTQYRGIGGSNCTVILGWTNETDSITSPKWGGNGSSTVSFAEGKSFQYQDTHSLADAASLREGATLIPFVLAAQLSVDQADVSDVRAWYPYTGSPIAPEPVVSYAGTALTRGTDYTLSYTNDHTSIGEKAVTITGMGTYTGTKTIPYKIVEASTTYLDDTGASKTCTAFQCLDKSDTTLSDGWYLVYGDLTINDRISLSGSVNLILKDGTTLTSVKGISVPSTASLTIYAQSNSESTAGKLLITDPEMFFSGIGNDYKLSDRDSHGNITIVGGVIEAKGGISGAAIGSALSASQGGNIVIKGGFVTANGTGGGAGIGSGANTDGGMVTINGGKVTATSIGGAAIGSGGFGDGKGSFGVINITGGTISAKSESGGAGIGGGSNSAGGTISITGGTITASASGDTGGAAIGGGKNASGGSITIQNATIAKAVANAGAGIGSGGGETTGTTKIIIGTGAKITNAVSTDGAGIGSGKNSSTACSVTIGSGAEVKAGGVLGAGIGGGTGASEFSVTIQGGTVNAWASGNGIKDKNGKLSAYGGAAIGGGANTNGGTVNIKDGTVTARAIGGGAGIGSGANTSTSATTDSGLITISGGNVTATATHHAAGIGGGRRSNGGTITISGGTIAANGSDAAGIGHGGEDTLWKGQGNYYIPIQTDPTQDTGGAYYDSIVQINGTNKTTTDGTVTFTYVDGGAVSITASSYPSSPTLSKPFKYSDTGWAVVATSIIDNKTIVNGEGKIHIHSFTYSADGATITATCSAEGCPLTNRQATLTIAAPASLTYDGTAKAATVSGDTTVLGTPTITYTKTGDTSFTGTPKNAGDYTASITLGEGDGAKTASVSYTIAPKSVTITGLSASNKEYDGTTTATVTGLATIDGKVGSDDVSVDASAGMAAFEDANVGTGKTVTFSGYALSGTAAGNYTLSAQPESVTANITQRPITITAANQSVVLNGEIATGTDKVSVTSGSLVSGHSITAVTLEASSTAAVTTTGTITPSGIAIQDGSNVDVTGNYNITPANGTLTVTKIKAQVTTTPAANNKTYNGLTENLLTGGAADTSLEYSTDGTAFSATVPQGKDVNSYTVFYRAAADSNHEPSDATSMTVTISKATLTVKANGHSITYGDAPTNNGVEYTGFVNNETADVLHGNVTYAYSYTQFGNVGTYTITPTYTPNANNPDNYAVTASTTDGVLTVQQKEVGISWTHTNDLEFTGSAQAPTASFTDGSIVNSDDVTLAVTGGQTDVGTGYTATATLTGTKAGNYKLPSAYTTTFSIGKAAALSLTNVEQSVLYTATSVSATVSGKMPENAGTLTYAKSSENGIDKVNSWNVNGTTGAVEATLSGGQPNDTITLPVTISSTNYADSTVNVVVTLTGKTDAGVSITPDGAQTKSYGDAAFTLTASVTSAGTGTGVWTWTSSNKDVAEVTTGGATTTVNIKAASNTSVTITAAYDSDTTTGQAAVTLTVNPKSVEIPTAVTGLKWTSNEQTGVADGDGYTVTDGKKTDVGNYTATATLTNTNYKWSDNTTTAKNIPWSIAKADGPAAPEGLAGVAPTSENGNDGKITGVTADMEYSTDGTTYTDCTGTEITGLSAGTYYVRIKETATHEAGAAATVTVTISQPYTPPSPPSPSSPATITIPVSGDAATVNLTVQVSGTTATITGADVEPVLSADKVGIVTVDVSGLEGGVDEVVLPGELLTKIATAVANPSSDASGMAIKLPTGTITFDAKAVAAIAAQADGKDLKLHLDSIPMNTLNQAQQVSVAGLNVMKVFDAYMTADGVRISDFHGGSATVTVSNQLQADQKPAGVVVWFVDVNGEKTETPSQSDGQNTKFTIWHLSNYVIAYDAARAEKPESYTYNTLTDEEKAQADALIAAYGTKEPLDKDTAAQMIKWAQKLNVPFETLLLTDEVLTNLPDDSDPAGTTFGKLTARATKRAKKSMTVQWKKFDQADGYLIYGNLCGKTKKLKLKKDIKGNGTLKWTQKKLKKGKYYKYMVVAYKNVGDKKMTLAASVVVHATTKGAKFTIAKSVKVKPTSVTLEIGQTAKLKASEVKAEKGKKIKRHRPVKYESDNLSVATVADDGTITAVGEGSAIIYVYAQNGLYKTVTVTVTPGQVVPNSVEEPETEADALQIDSLTVPDVDGEEIVLDDATVEDESIDSAETETSIILEDDAMFID